MVKLVFEKDGGMKLYYKIVSRVVFGAIGIDASPGNGSGVCEEDRIAQFQGN